MTLLSYVVDRETAGMPVRDLMRRRFKLSRSLYRRLWADDAVRVDGAVALPFAPLLEGQIITLALAKASRVDPEPIALAIAYEDDDVVVVDKPAGMVVHPTNGVVSGTLAAGLAFRFGGFHLVNRLDCETSGLVLVARHALAAQRLASALGRREIHRTYHALVHGIPDESAGRIEAPIARVPGQARRGIDPDGKVAVTNYRVLASTLAWSLVELALETGRTHQIRVHMAHVGHPVAGDDRYGPDPRIWPRLCLHAHELEFPHPGSGAIIRLVAPWPPDLPAPPRAIDIHGDTR